ncbi:hypothetical protein AL036_18915 [Salipiger aestuarii]|uniref:Uncharacterized protein DUF2842 n=1 Tax=Salipiger aestuarii TaxID=568098 RepID=A0A327Y3L1_9RHOB|nr:DUF2842 domain-containing protein [Salipiger aestuarii]EIE49930.1 hypothetical protein C357_16446 [Citreicella sp. 357]KAA8605478.1 hypothetical protein AL036_18915 [Salipiger aestuarii]KAA8606701.1 hypothetical protein AL037_19990 [Salipiger aestuarii]KAB2541656.1 hypothetical protein AL035_11395 [Salipiger aestuarii]RAK14922.1 uncharacterized protein DUF2842 [Salipiger aestuarii]
MPLRYKTRKRLALLLLVVWLPLYIAAAVSLVNALDRPPIWAELLVYVVLGFVWVLPFKFIFRGVGREDPDAPDSDAP